MLSVKYIKLNDNYKAAVDEEDYAKLSGRTWYVSKRSGAFYVQSDSPTRVYMHRVIMDCPDDMEVDHIDGNGLNNCKFNLRVCAHQQNCQSTKKQIGTTSIYKGVSWNKRDKFWEAYIKKDRIRYRLGYYKEEVTAAERYDLIALLLFGEFAKLNFSDKKDKYANILERLAKLEEEKK